MKDIRVVIADDDAMVRGALSEVLQADPRFSVVGTAADGDELVRVVDVTAPDVVLLDVRMPGGGPLAATALAAGRPGRAGRGDAPLVIAVSAHTGSTSVLAMLRAGAVGYLAKGGLSGALPDLVARCAGGEVVLAVPSGGDALRQLVRAAQIPA
jgi:DNA-binding NarL/FixJ family response regulator